MKPASLLPSLLLSAALLCSSCAFPKDKTFTPTEAEKKLMAFCLKEGPVTVLTRRIGKTLWVYIPLEEPIFDVRPSGSREKAERKVQPLALLSLVAEYSERYFKFNFDIVPDVLSGEPTTYRQAYNETYTKKRQLIYQALQESFFNAKTKGKDLMPEFVVIMVADINKGVATKSILYLNDLKQYITEAIPPNEYYMRELNEVIGKEELIHDKLGKNAPYAEVTWTYFLTNQIKNRIKFKLLSPGNETDESNEGNDDLSKNTDLSKEIAKIAANTLRFYPFGDYDGVVLYDVRAKKELALKKPELRKYAEKAGWEEDKEKLTTIHFQMPQSPDAEVNAASTTPAETNQPQ